MNLAELFGFLGGLFLTVGMVPQVCKLFILKSAYEISLTFIVSLIFGIFFWLIYGILNMLFPVVFWNAIGLILVLLMLYAKLKWGQK